MTTTASQTPDLPPLIGPDAAWEAECERDYGPYPAEAPLADRLRWWVPKSAKLGLCAVESDLLEAADLAAQQAAPFAYASSKRANQVLSAAQFKNCLPKIQAEFDILLYAVSPGFPKVAQAPLPDAYIIDRGADGRVLPKDAQVRMCGNSVCPPLARAIVAANYSERDALKEAT